MRRVWPFFLLLIFLGGHVEAKTPKRMPAQEYVEEMDTDFNIPLPFSLSTLQGKALPPQLEYEVAADSSLIFAEKSIRTRSFRMEFSTKDGNLDKLSFYWPATFLPAGDLQIYDEKGRGLWKTTISEDNVQQQVIKEEDEQIPVKAFTSESLGRSERRALRGAKSWEFCFRRAGSNFHISYCSGPMSMRRVGELRRFIGQGGEKPVKIVLNGKEVKPRGVVNFNSFDVKLSFIASVGPGGVYKIESVPVKVDILDAVNLGEGKIMLKGLGGPPIGKGVEMLEEGQWRATLNSEKAELVVLGSGEIPFRSPFVITGELANENDRVYLHKRAPATTYNSRVTVQGVAPAKYTLRVDKAIIKKQSPPPGRFAWRLIDLEQAKLNRRTIRLLDDKNKTEIDAYYEVYRGFPYELSMRVSGVLADDGTNSASLLYFGELAGGVWFERLMNWHNHWLSEQRWGLNAKYFTALNTGVIGTARSYTADIKYRFTPGIWNQDESWGLIGGYLNFQGPYDGAVGMMGGGVFWARTMPRIFDRIFNIIPWFRYPKWVDAEFISYNSSLSSNYKLGPNFKVAFHGKMSFTPRVFLEGGFGMYSLDYTNTTTSAEEQFAMSYGTLGLGVNF